MAANPLRLAQQRALADNHFLDKLLTQAIGGKDYPQGRLLTLYRNARRAMATALAERDYYRRRNAAAEVLSQLHADVLPILNGGLGGAGVLGQAADRGVETVKAQLQAYVQDDPALAVWAGDLPDLSLLTAGWTTAVDLEINRLNVLVALDVDAAILLGDEHRVGDMSPGRLGREVAQWAALALALGFTTFLWGRDERKRDESPYDKQAIACCDRRTTRTCLLVNGQVQPLKGRFELKGPERYADRIDWPPFHGYCRTSVALYLARYDDGLTAKLRALSEPWL